MKKLLGILMILILIAGVFVSCSQDKIEEAVISGEELLDVRFGAASGRARDLVVDTPVFDDGDYVWYYTAKKADTTGFNTGVTSGLTPVKPVTSADRTGLEGEVISGLSQGYWDFGLYAYVPVEEAQHDYRNDSVAWQGSVSHFLLVKGAANVVDVTVSPSTQGKGWLVISNEIYVKDANGNTVPITTTSGTSLAYTVTRVGGTEPVDITKAIDAGAYVVKVVCTGSNIDYAEESIVVNVYSGLTRTVSGWIGELTTSATFGNITGEIIEASTPKIDQDYLNHLTTDSVKFTSDEGTVPVTASLPKTAAQSLLNSVTTPGSSTDLTLTLNVKADAESTSTQQVTTKAYNIDLVQKVVTTTESTSTTTVSNVTEALTDYLTATLTIDKNLSSVSVKHSNVSMVDLAGATAPTADQIAADAANGYPGFYNYDSATGVLTLITKKFSPFEVTYTKPVNGIAAVYRGSTLVASCKSLTDAIELAVDGDVVKVLEDTSYGSDAKVSKDIGINIKLAGIVDVESTDAAYALAGPGYAVSFVYEGEGPSEKLVQVNYAKTDAVARIGGLYYESLQAAFDAALEGDTVVLINDYEVASPAEVLDYKNFAFDLNGYTLSAALKQTGRHHYAIDNYGTIKIKDSGDSGKIIARGIENLKNATMTIESGTFYSIDGNGGACVWNEGSLTVDGGSFIVEGGATDPNYGAGCINSRSGSVLTINNGSMISDNARCYAIIADGTTVINNADVEGTHGGLAVDTGSLTVNGGSFECSNYYGLFVTNDSTGGTNVVINGGIFAGGSVGQYALLCTVDDGHQDMSDAAVVINDGTFIGYGSAAAISMNPKTSTHTWELTVKGGLYSTDPSVYVPEEGYIVTEAEGWYKVSPIPMDVRITKDDSSVEPLEMTLAGFRNSVNSGNSYEGYTVTLLRDVNLEGINWSPIGSVSETNVTGVYSGNCFSGTFDGDNHSISNLQISNSSGEYQGFFGWLKNATVKKLTINDADVAVKKKSGILAALVDYSCVFDHVTIDSDSSISGKSNIGGMVGVFQGREDECIDIIDCSVSANITATEDRAGGFFGTIYWSDATAWVIDSSVNGKIHGGNRLGGFVGRSSSSMTSSGKMERGLHFKNFSMTATIDEVTDRGYIIGWQSDEGLPFITFDSDCSYKDFTGNIKNFSLDTPYEELCHYYDTETHKAYFGVNGTLNGFETANKTVIMPAMSYELDWSSHSAVYTITANGTHKLEFSGSSSSEEYIGEGNTPHHYRYYDFGKSTIKGSEGVVLQMRVTDNFRWFFDHNSNFYDGDGKLLPTSDRCDTYTYNTREFTWDLSLGTEGGWRQTNQNFAF